MRGPGRKIPSPPSNTDMQSRLRYIQERAANLPVGCDQSTINEIGYLIGYLAKILEKHLQTKEE